MTSPLISTEWCFRPYKPYISCEDIWSHAPHVFRGAIQVDTFFTRWMPIASLLSSKSIRYRVAQNACIRAFLEEIIYLPILTKWRPQVLFIVGKLCDTFAQIFSFILRPCHTLNLSFAQSSCLLIIGWAIQFVTSKTLYTHLWQIFITLNLSSYQKQLQTLVWNTISKTMILYWGIFKVSKKLFVR